MQVHAIGVLGLIAVLVTLALAVRAHPWAGWAAFLTGSSTAIGLVLVHVLPRWSAFSDPYPEARVDAFSWAIVVVIIGAGVLLSKAGLTARKQ